VLVKHFLVANLIVDLVFEVELHAVQTHHLVVFVAVVAQPVHLLVNHLHYLVLVEAVEVCSVAPYDFHLVVREIVFADDALQSRDVVATAVVARAAAA